MVLLSALVMRFNVSRMQDFYIRYLKGTATQNIFSYKVVQRIAKISEITLIYKNN